MRFFRPLLPVRWLFREGHFRLKGKEKCVCLSFDDGPDPAVTPEILKILDKYKVKAVFFCKGSEAEKYPSLVDDIRSRGHLIGNHTYSHLKGIKTSVDESGFDVDRSSNTIIAIYDTFQLIIEQLIGHATMLLISYSEEGLRLATDTATKINTEKAPLPVSTEQQDDILLITVTEQKGGE